MKKRISLLFTFVVMMCLMVCLSVNVSAAEIVETGSCGAEGDNVTWTLYDNGELVISGEGEMLDYYHIDSPFSGNDDIKNIVIKDGVTSIESNTFEDCESLISIVVPKSVITIGDGAFYNCASLESIHVDLDNQYYSNDGYGVLFNKDKSQIIKYPEGRTETSYTIPDSVISIDHYAFKNSKIENITIPDNVISIGEYAFDNSAYYNNSENWKDDELYIGKYLIKANTSISSEYNIKPGTLVVADGAVAGDLTSITIPESVISIGGGAFSASDSFLSITVDENNQYYSNDEYGVLFNKDKSQIVKYPSGRMESSYVIPDSVTSIGRFVFHNCYNLTSVSIPECVTSIGEFAFAYCNITNITIPDNVEIIGDYAFIGVNTSLTIPGRVTSIGRGAFMLTPSTNLTIPDSVTSIGTLAFYKCEKIANLTIGNDLTTLEYGVFAECISLTSVTIPDCITSIGYGAFAYCANLTKITVPNSVTNMGEGAFNGCTNLADVYFDGTEEEWNNISIASNNDPLLNATIHFNECSHIDSDTDSFCDNCGEIFIVDEGNCGANGDNVIWKLYSNGELVISGEGEMADYNYSTGPFKTLDFGRLIVNSGVTSIGSYSFYNCEKLINVELPSGLIDIGRSAFCECANLVSITIPNTVVSIGPWALGWCEKLQYIEIPDSVVDIGFNAFSSTGIANITIPYSVTNIGDGAFSSCEKLESITVDNGNVFYSSIDGVLYDKTQTVLIQYPTGSGRVSYVIPENVISIEDDAFSRCNLESVVIPDSVIGIGEFTFFMCVQLTDIVIPDNVTSIGDRAFCNCYNLGSVKISNSVTSIEPSTFQSCYKLNSITIPNSVTSIGEYAFLDCENLVNVTIGNSVTSVGLRAFEGCASLTDVYYSGTEEEWNNISIAEGNDSLHNAIMHYNEVLCDHADLNADTYCDNCGEIFVINKGNCGENATFKLYSDGTLIIDGEGDMWNFAYVGEDDLFGMPEYMTWAYEEIDGEMCLAGDKTIKKVIVSDGITRIGNYAFQACRALEEVEIADTVTSIGEAAFDFCTSLKHIRIPGSVKILEQEAFSESALETIEIEEGLERIETLAFFYCLNLKEVNLPESVEYIGDFAFIICDKLETLVINNKACEIGLEILMTGELDEDGNIIEDENGNPIPTECPTVLKGYSGSTAEEYANTWTEAGYQIKFEALDVHIHLDSDKNGNCDNCGEIFIVDEGNCGANGDNVTWELLSNGNLTIRGNGAMADNFTKFGKLYIKNVVIESGVTSIGSWAFARCDDLVSIEIPDTVTSIGDSAFSGCESLTAVTIPTGVTTIGIAAFFNCKSLESVVIPAGITNIAELSFCGCKNLTNVSIKKSVTYVGKKAFDGCTSLVSVDFEGTKQEWAKITIKSGNAPLLNATKHFGAVCRHTEDGHETETFEEIIDEPNFFKDGSYEEITKCKNCGAELSREIKKIPDVSLLDTIVDEIEEAYKATVSALAKAFRRILKIFGKK